MRGPFKSRKAEIEALRKRVPRYRVPMPDLKCEQRSAPLSNNLPCKFSSQRSSGASHPDAIQFPSATLFKQGPQLITPGDISSGRVKDYGGHKPNKGLYE